METPCVFTWFINSTRLDPVIADQGTKRNVSKRIGIKPLITSMSRGQPVVNPLILGCCLTQQSLHLLEFVGCFRCFFLVGEPKLKLPSPTVAGMKSITSFNHFVATLGFILPKVYTVICWVKQSRKHDWFQGFREPQFLTPTILLLHFVDITVAPQRFSRFSRLKCSNMFHVSWFLEAQTGKSLQVQLLSRNLINCSLKKIASTTSLQA